MVALARPLSFLGNRIRHLDLLLDIVACILAIDVQIEIGRPWLHVGQLVGLWRPCWILDLELIVERVCIVFSKVLILLTETSLKMLIVLRISSCLFSLVIPSSTIIFILLNNQVLRILLDLDIDILGWIRWRKIIRLQFSAKLLFELLLDTLLDIFSIQMLLRKAFIGALQFGWLVTFGPREIAMLILALRVAACSISFKVFA